MHPNALTRSEVCGRPNLRSRRIALNRGDAIWRFSTAKTAPMKFEIRVKQLRRGEWQARYIGGKVETIDLIDASKEAVLERMRENIRYHLEYCP
jgi:hypothetical protein